MRIVLLRKKKMYSAVLAVLIFWEPVWKMLSAFSDSKEQLQKYISDIEAKEATIKGSEEATANKNQKMKDMLKVARAVIGAGASFARKTSNIHCVV